MPTPNPTRRQRTTSTTYSAKHSTPVTPRRAARAQRASNSSNSSNSSSGTSALTLVSTLSDPQAGDRTNLKKSLADYSPASEALSLTEETDVDEREDGEDESDADEMGMGLEEWDDEWEFEPKPGDAVWVKSRDTEREVWYYGHVQKSTRIGTVRGGKQGTFYSVRYHRNLRRYFAPLLGEIKPDTPRVRRLLEQAGCDLEL